MYTYVQAVHTHALRKGKGVKLQLALRFQTTFTIITKNIIGRLLVAKFHYPN